jgi:hypothetical protein
MFRASSCPSSGEWYETDNAYGLQHLPCCSRLVEKRWLVCTCWNSFHMYVSMCVCVCMCVCGVCVYVCACVCVNVCVYVCVWCVRVCMCTCGSKHVEAPINTSFSASSWLIIHLHIFSTLNTALSCYIIICGEWYLASLFNEWKENQIDATVVYIYLAVGDALHVSGVFAHHQERQKTKPVA